MMNEQSPEFLELLNAVLNDTITAEEHARLCTALRGNPKAISEYLMSIDLHAGFRELEERSEDESTVAASMLPGVIIPESGETSFKPDQTVRSRPSGTTGRRSGRRTFWGVGIGAVGVTALLAAPFLFSPGTGTIPNFSVGQTESPGEQKNSEPEAALVQAPSVTEPSAALLSQAANAELFYEQVPHIGAPVKMGHEYTLVKGLLELSFNNGATAVISAPAVFTVADAFRIEMKMGRCSVHATETATGFEVVTPQGRVVDLGTRFSVTAKEAGESDLQVVEGAVIYHPKSGEESGKMLLEGEAVRFPEVAQKTESIPFNRNDYQNEFPDRVISYTASRNPDGTGVQDLATITIQRGGVVRTVAAADLIGVDVLHFSAYSKTSNACSGKSVPPKIDQLLTNNLALNCGITNFDRPPGPYEPAEHFSDFRQRYGLAVQFHEPVINGPGLDVVLFELQSSAYPPGGDRFYLSPIEDRTGLKTHHVQQYDITMHSANALTVAPLFTHVFDKPQRTIESLMSSPVKRPSQLYVPFRALAVGIDLSDLGYQDGASVPGILIEDADEDDFIAPDIVFIGGLPHVR